MPRKRKRANPTPTDENKFTPSKKLKTDNSSPNIKAEPVKVEPSDIISPKVEQSVLAERFTPKTESTNTNTMFVGAHVSAAGGVHNAISNAVNIGCKAFALFVKSQRKWVAKPLEPDVIEKFKAAMMEHGFEPHLVVPHGSYLINCGSPNAETLAKSKQGLIDELKRAEQLGLTRYNFHPGSTCGKQSVEKSISQIAESINEAHTQTEQIMTIIENMSCQGNTIGGKFEELAAIIEKVKDKSRIGVCLDTCHAFAAGFDLKTEEGYADMMDKFDKLIGFNYLKAVHLNDSKGDVGCHLDRHELIGKGKLGKQPFKWIMNDKRFQNVPLILETPDENAWEREIKLLYSMMEK